MDEASWETDVSEGEANNKDGTGEGDNAAAGPGLAQDGGDDSVDLDFGRPTVVYEKPEGAGRVSLTLVLVDPFCFWMQSCDHFCFFSPWSHSLVGFLNT